MKLLLSLVTGALVSGSVIPVALMGSANNPNEKVNQIKEKNSPDHPAWFSASKYFTPNGQEGENVMKVTSASPQMPSKKTFIYDIETNIKYTNVEWVNVHNDFNPVNIYDRYTLNGIDFYNRSYFAESREFIKPYDGEVREEFGNASFATKEVMNFEHAWPSDPAVIRFNLRSGISYYNKNDKVVFQFIFMTDLETSNVYVPSNYYVNIGNRVTISGFIDE
ncbi:hypothetical protein CXP39_03250 [Mesoplasma syrphidae]|uniref:Uncharacterized protein n=1 Tax=Mesoplasma syrphidae TaxID=225999 RepID=A0A2K9BS14_9MOLU|nr:hypothetical protein [Mesoplasma syrphidae]AUF83792.1 hypothetical protein CXP39_03250 [Mesoplasma syrphidae]